MKNCGKYLKKMYMGAFLYLLLILNLSLDYNFVFKIIISFILFMVSMTYVLPYFKCIGDNFRREKFIKK